ncbi:hypothetical protein FB45DRAFT_868901 [Roridomyces roridus]|uniref:Uncharacterized protein n=1 Tax=Roridomyces roridus TaxID=1738132 RepID=A0AAD7BMW5_9AGAR|nr:hypothetical protein FB45DRAFT_868901 [Roridomyces roridus]
MPASKTINPPADKAHGQNLDKTAAHSRVLGGTPTSESQDRRLESVLFGSEYFSLPSVFLQGFAGTLDKLPAPPETPKTPARTSERARRAPARADKTPPSPPTPPPKQPRRRRQPDPLSEPGPQEAPAAAQDPPALAPAPDSDPVVADCYIHVINSVLPTSSDHLRSGTSPTVPDAPTNDASDSSYCTIR